MGELDPGKNHDKIIRVGKRCQGYFWELPVSRPVVQVMTGRGCAGASWY